MSQQMSERIKCLCLSIFIIQNMTKVSHIKTQMQNLGEHKMGSKKCEKTVFFHVFRDTLYKVC